MKMVLSSVKCCWRLVAADAAEGESGVWKSTDSVLAKLSHSFTFTFSNISNVHFTGHFHVTNFELCKNVIIYGCSTVNWKWMDLMGLYIPEYYIF